MKILLVAQLSPLLLAATGLAETLFVDVAAQWDGKAFQVPSQTVRTASGESLRFTRVSFLLSKPSIKTEGGQRLAMKDWYAFVDLAGGTRPLAFSNLPAGEYRGLRMHLGLDEKTNGSDPNQYPAFHALNPLVNKLHWSPQGGYIFLAVEGFLEREGEDDLGFAYHIGNAASHLLLEFDLQLDLSTDRSAQLIFHLDRLFSGESPLKAAEQSSTHSRPGDPLNAYFSKQIPAAFSLGEMEQTERDRNNAFISPSDGIVGTPYRFQLRRGFPVPALPLDVPLSNERVALGKRLFHDPMLAGDNSMACASCHVPSAARSDHRRFSEGVAGKKGTRNSMPLVNLAWKRSFFWDGRASSLRKQVLDPIQDPLELHSDLDQLVKELRGQGHYPALFARAFGDDTISAERLAIALEQFLLTLTSFDSRFDEAAAGRAELSEQEKRGFELFMTEYDPRREQFGADCFHCHGGAFFTDHAFHNNGVEPGKDFGLEIATGKKSDRFKFSTPSLRNIALTAPYMHDGRFDTLEEVVAHYATGIHRTATLDPNLAKHPGRGIPLNGSDQAALVAFLKTLSDPQFMKD